MKDRLRLVLATPLEEEFCRLVERIEPRIEFVRDHSLLPPQRHPGDHYGEQGWARAEKRQAEFERSLLSADALYGIPDLSPELLKRVVAENPRLRWVQAMAAGAAAQIRQASLTAAEIDRVQFTTSSGVHAAPLAEFAVFGVLAGAKGLLTMLDEKQRHTWGPKRILGQIAEERIAVVGLGAIGAETARALSALGASVVGVNRARRDIPQIAEFASIDDMVRAVSGCAALVVALPGSADTDGLVNAEVLAALQPRATVVNVGRGSVVDEAALIDAVHSGQVGFALLDVTEHEPLSPESPLWELPNVLITPHTAALSSLEDRRIAELAAENAGRLLDGRPLRNAIAADELMG